VQKLESLKKNSLVGQRKKITSGGATNDFGVPTSENNF
jgi:hypothetical protein